jgi:hypothetical protein
MGILEKSVKFYWNPMAKVICEDHLFAFENKVTVPNFCTLPWQRTTKEVDENVC